MNAYVKVSTTQRVYKVRTTSKNVKYILMNKNKVLLSDIKGKYRYFKQNAATSYEYTIDGDKKILEHTNYKTPIFRKHLSRAWKDGLRLDKELSDDATREKQIAEIINKITDKADASKLIRIYNVDTTDGFYDAEVLDTNKTMIGNMPKVKQHIQECLETLHKYGIIYVDLKWDNIGYSTVDKRWKLFDFDCSGTIHNRPPPYYAFKHAVLLKYGKQVKYDGDGRGIFNVKVEDAYFRNNLFEIDDILFQNMFQSKT